MPMISIAMAAQMKSDLDGCTSDGLSKMWDSICSYVKSNAQVLYSWVAFSSSVPPTPDPMVVITASIDTSGSSLSVPGIDQITDTDTALSMISAGMNLSAAKWKIKFPTGFSVSPCFVIPSISLRASNSSIQMTALQSICSDVISGITAATPGMAGTHTIYTGTGIFSSIM